MQQRSRHDQAEAFRIPDDRPVKITVELPAPVFSDLRAYAAILAKTAGRNHAARSGQARCTDAQRLMTTDKGFSKAKRSGQAGS
ncbi:DUF2274 domain-containing protein [Agrobacterium sp. 22-209-1]